MAKSIRVQVAEVEAKIEKLQAALADLRTKADNEVDTSAVQAGRTITYNYGKAPNIQVLTGLVVGRKDREPGAKGGDLVKVAFGQGFDAAFHTIYPQAVINVHPLPVAEAEAA